MGHLARLRWTQKRFAMEVGITQAYLSRVLRNQRAVPYSGIEAWADALGLVGAERERFMLLGESTRASQRVQEAVGKYLRSTDASGPGAP